jgi:hypothetical protein
LLLTLLEESAAHINQDFPAVKAFLMLCRGYLTEFGQALPEKRHHLEKGGRLLDLSLRFQVSSFGF